MLLMHMLKVNGLYKGMITQYTLGCVDTVLKEIMDNSLAPKL